MAEDSKSATDAQADLQIPHLQIIELIGKGGMSVVYKARQLLIDRVVALKILSSAAIGGDAGIKRFQNEARLTSLLDHPNIIKTLSFGISTDSRPYLILEYLQGRTLADELDGSKQLTLQRFRDVFIPALNALAHAHESAVIHRDIKPSNIFLSQDANGIEVVKVLDFGIAKDTDSTSNAALTRTGVILGSPAYMSPEQCQGKMVDQRSDIYALACVMYESLTGKPLFAADSPMELMRQHCLKPPPTVAQLTKQINIDERLARIVLAALAKDPAARPQSATEFASALIEALDGVTLDKVPKLLNKTQSWTRQPHILLWTFGSIILFSICAVTYHLVSRNTDKQRQDIQQLVSRKTSKPNIALTHKRASLEQQLARAERSQDQAAIIDSLDKLADYEGEMRDYQAQEIWAKRALELKKKRFKNAKPLLLATLDRLHDCLSKQEKNAESEAVLEESLEICRTSNIAAENEILVLLHIIPLCIRLKENDKAEQYCHRAISLSNKYLPKGDRDIGRAEIGLAQIYRNEHKANEAKSILRQLDDRFDRGEVNNVVAVTAILDLASYCKSEGDYKGGLAFVQKAEAIALKDPSDDINLAFICDEHAQMLMALGLYKEATNELRKALRLREGKPDSTYYMIINWCQLCNCADALHDRTNQISFFEKAQQEKKLVQSAWNVEELSSPLQFSSLQHETAYIFLSLLSDKIYGSYSANSFQCLLDLARCYRRLRKPAKALPTLSRCLLMCDKGTFEKDEKDSRKMDALEIKAGCLVDMQRYAEAEKLYKSGVKERPQNVLGLASCYVGEKKFAQARELINSTIAANESDQAMSMSTLDGIIQLADRFDSSDDHADANELRKYVVERAAKINYVEADPAMADLLRTNLERCRKLLHQSFEKDQDS